MAYVGIHDYDKSDGTWLNVFFEMVKDQNYVRWQKSTDEKSITNESNCVAIDEDGYLVVTLCRSKHSFICEAEF